MNAFDLFNTCPWIEGQKRATSGIIQFGITSPGTGCLPLRHCQGASLRDSSLTIPPLQAEWVGMGLLYQKANGVCLYGKLLVGG